MRWKVVPNVIDDDWKVWTLTSQSVSTGRVDAWWLGMSDVDQSLRIIHMSRVTPTSGDWWDMIWAMQRHWGVTGGVVSC